MENRVANQLPEVDSLPDGFVESAIEPLSPRTPAVDQEEKSSDDYKDTLSEIDTGSTTDSKHAFDSSADIRADKVEKMRTFPVELSDKDGFDGLNDLGEVGSNHNKGVRGSSEGGLVVGSDLGSNGADGLTTGSSHEKENVERVIQTSDQSTGGSLEQQATNLEQKPTSDVNLPNNKKLETSEVKRKSVKRGFKSEKEFLEFTLKYQQVIAERDSAVAVRDKLESLCRELQRQNKILMDECKRVSTEGQNMRLDLSTRFHDAIKDVSHKLEEQKDECLTQLKENDMLRNKLKHLADQYAVSEQQFAQKLKQKTLELQLADLKIQQHQEKLTQEQSQMKLYAEQVSQLLTTEKNLRLQLATDGEKFQQFQDALLKSNEVFETFKQEIEKMAKSIKELKKENTFLKGKCDRSDYTLIELVDEREHTKKQVEKLKNQKEKLESLCRSLQAERKQVSGGSNNAESVPS